MNFLIGVLAPRLYLDPMKSVWPALKGSWWSLIKLRRLERRRSQRLLSATITHRRVEYAKQDPSVTLERPSRDKTTVLY